MLSSGELGMAKFVNTILEIEAVVGPEEAAVSLLAMLDEIIELITSLICESWTLAVFEGLIRFDDFVAVTSVSREPWELAGDGSRKIVWLDERRSPVVWKTDIDAVPISSVAVMVVLALLLGKFDEGVGLSDELGDGDEMLPPMFCEASVDAASLGAVEVRFALDPTTELLDGGIGYCEVRGFVTACEIFDRRELLGWKMRDLWCQMEN